MGKINLLNSRKTRRE